LHVTRLSQVARYRSNKNLWLAVYVLQAVVGTNNEATVRGYSCRLAPVAIGELNLSELYVTRPATSIVLVRGLRTVDSIRVSVRVRAREPTTDRTARSGFPRFRPFAEVISIFLYPDG